MEWRQQTSFSCAEAFSEAQRWIEGVTGKAFGCSNFRAALENGVLLCDLINQLKPGIIKRLNRFSTPIAGLDNVNVFLKACGKLGLNESQLFHPGDLQDLSTRVNLRRDESNRRLKNVLITIYWLGRKAHLDAFYSGPQLNFKAFEGLLGLALSKALDQTLDEGNSAFVRDGPYPEREEFRQRQSYKRENSVESVESLDERMPRLNCEGCGSDAEAEQVFRMEINQQPAQQSRGHIPPPLLRRKQGREAQDSGCSSPFSRTSQVQVTSERQCRVNPGWIWSKSLSDIPMVYPVRKISEGNTVLNSGQSQAKDSEAQWQDDLTKWKNRRRSTKSDPRRKSFDREHVINQMANGAVSDAEKKEAAGGRLKSSPRDQLSPRRHDPAPHSYAAPPPSKPPSTHPRPHTRALLARGFATEVLPGGSMPASDGIILGEETHLASLPSNGAGATTPSPDCTFSSQTSIKAQCGPSPLQPAVEALQPDKCVADQTSPATTFQTKLAGDQPAAVAALKETPFCVEAKVPAPHTNAPADGSHQEGSQKTAREAAAEQVGGRQAAGSYKYLSGSGPWSSASLPRGYRRSEGSSRLSSVITARPFGSKQSRVSSLPRLFNVDDNLGLLAAAEKESPLSPADSSLLKRQSTTALPRVQSQASIRLNKADLAQRAVSEQQQEGRGASLSGQTNGYHHHPEAKTQLLAKQQTCKSPTMPSNGSTELPMVDYSDMRVSLTLKPNSRPYFGFQTNWDSTGARLKYIEPGSPAELCRLRVDDEILAVDGVAVARMSYSQWESKMTSALQSGSLTMDVRRYGNKGVPDHHVNGNASPQTTVLKVNGKADDVTQVKVFDGELGDSRSTGVSKGGSESAISNLQVPSLSPSSSSWSWDHEEERRRQEKWQEEQERLLQEQYQRDQQRLEAEWQRAQHDAMLEENTFEKSSGGGGIPARAPRVNGLANKPREEQSTDGENKETEAGSKPATSPSDAHVVHDDKINEQDWAKSLSTPALGGPHKQLRADQRKRKGECVSKAEQERKQILEEMKKRTQLLTDNSWIRQRSSSLYKEPVYAGVPLKRYESLDNLDILRQSPLSTHTFSYPRPHSAAAGYFAPSRSVSRHSAGPVLSQRNTPTDPNHGSVWAAADISEEQKPESRSASETGGCTANPAISNSSHLVPPLCDQNVLLQITE